MQDRTTPTSCAAPRFAGRSVGCVTFVLRWSLKWCGSGWSPCHSEEGHSPDVGIRPSSLVSRPPSPVNLKCSPLRGPPAGAVGQISLVCHCLQILTTLAKYAMLKDKKGVHRWTLDHISTMGKTENPIGSRRESLPPHGLRRRTQRPHNRIICTQRVLYKILCSFARG